MAYNLMKPHDQNQTQDEMKFIFIFISYSSFKINYWYYVIFLSRHVAEFDRTVSSYNNDNMEFSSKQHLYK